MTNDQLEVLKSLLHIQVDLIHNVTNKDASTGTKSTGAYMYL